MSNLRRQRWRKMKKNQSYGVEQLLKSQERWCVNACNRFLNHSLNNTNIWILGDRVGEISALIIHSNQLLMPVLCGQKIPSPHFLYGIFGVVPVHSLQGRKEDAVILEAELEKNGLCAAESNDYDIMCIDHVPSGFQSVGPSGLTIRKPVLADMDALVSLHAAYEQEEVLPAASEFNATASRMSTQRIFSREQMLVAELGGRLVGKINTNAAAFTRFQIGGVYVHPDYRNQGIARRMAGEFAAGLVAQGRGISLFVKKSNIPARRVYQCIGFEVSGDYRISYY